VVKRSGSSERRRVAACGALGAVAAIPSALVAPWQLVVLIGWSSSAAVLLAWVWVEIGRLDAVQTAHVATREDDSRAAARTVLVASSVMSLLAVGAALHRAASATFGLGLVLTAASLISVVLSWLVVNTVFVLRYAHLYYGRVTTRDVEFPGGQAPGYRDFAYLAFTVGMTFQVSDTVISDPTIRATVLRHALLAFLFNVAIIATTINVIAGLV
jgi:uncharacterized membrane protein